MKKTLLFLMALLTLGAGGAWAQTGTITYSISTYSSAGSFSSTQVWNSNGTPKMTMTYSGNNGYNTGNGRIFKGNYTLSVSGGYIITGYSITGHSAWNGSNGDVERITPATGTITDGDGNTVTYLDFAGSDVTLNVSDLNSQSVSFTMAQTAGTGNGAFDATAITITYQVDPQLAIPQLTTDLSSPKYYSIKSYNRGGYLSSNGLGQAMTHVDFKDGSVWYFTAADGNTSGNAMNGVIAHNFDGTAMTTSWQTSETGGTVYILPNGVNVNGLSISKTASISNGSCCDANNSNTGVGNYDPRGNDWQGTTWVIEPTIPSGYYYFKGMDTGRYPYLYSNFVGKSENATFHHSPLSGTNGEIWKVTNNGSSLSIINGEGLPLTIGTTTYETLNIGSVAEGPDFYFTEAINLTNHGNDTKLTTWADHPDATDNHWTFEAVNVSAGLYNVVIEGNANGYVTYNGQNAKNGGFFVAENIASSDLIAFDISDYTETVSVDATAKTITVNYTTNITYTLTDMNRATYSWSASGSFGTAPTLTGCAGYTLSNEAWDEENRTYTADITFPFPVSSNNVSNYTYIGSFASLSRTAQWTWRVASKNSVDVTTQSNVLPTNETGENEKWEWLIIPTCSNGVFTFTIKNAATNTFITCSSQINHNQGSVTLTGTGTPLSFVDGNAWKTSSNNYLSVNSYQPDPSDLIQYLGQYGNPHYGTNTGFITPADFTSLMSELKAARTSFNNYFLYWSQGKYTETVEGTMTSTYNKLAEDGNVVKDPPTEYFTAAQFKTYTDAYKNAVAGLSYVMPTFFRVKNLDGTKYAKTSSLDYANYVQLDFSAGGNDATSIFYLNASNNIMSYYSGLYLFAMNHTCPVSWTDWKCSYEFLQGSAAGQIYVHVVSNPSNWGGEEKYWSGAGDKMGRVVTPTADSDLLIEEVTSLPVTFKGQFASFFSPVDLTLADGVKAYTGTLTDNNTILTLTEVDYVPANTGVILEYEAFSSETTLNFPILSTVNPIVDTSLTGSTAAQNVAADSKLVLGKSGENWGIYKYGGTTLGGFKAYMEMPATPVKGFTFTFGDADAIANVLNGEENVNEVYDLSGRRVNVPARGLYIVNGKKVVIK